MEEVERPRAGGGEAVIRVTLIGDSIFALGAISFVYFALNLMWQRPEKKAAPDPAVKTPIVPAAAEGV